MLDDATYRQWTTAFSPGSYFVGDWSLGSKMLFLGPHSDGSGEAGMVSRIADNKLYEFLSIEHLGIVKDGVEDTTSEEAKKWSPAFENYTFRAMDGGTEVQVDIDVDDEHAELFEGMWNEALKQLKTLAEAE